MGSGQNLFEKVKDVVVPKPPAREGSIASWSETALLSVCLRTAFAQAQAKILVYEIGVSAPGSRGRASDPCI